MRPASLALLTIDYIHHALFFEVAGLEYVACGKILLFCCAEIIMFGVDGEMSALVLVQDATEDRGRIKVGPDRTSALMSMLDMAMHTSTCSRVHHPWQS